MSKSRKDQLKEKYNILRKAGYSSKDAQKYRHKSYDWINEQVRTHTKKEQAANRQARAKENYQRLKAAGLSSKDAARLRYANDDTIREILSTGQAQPKGQRKRTYTKKYAGNDTLLVFWKDKTEGFTDEDRPFQIREDYRHDTIPYLIQDIKGSMSIAAGEIGTYQMVITDNPRGMKQFFAPELGMSAEYVLLYEGQAQTYKPLLVLTATMMMLLYDPFEDKFMFVMDLIQNVKHFNPTLAARLRRDLGIR